jgi:hypothetical protein
MQMAKTDFEGEAFKTPLQIAVEEESAEAIQSLDKSEAVFYVQYKLTGEFPEGNPVEHNGNVTRTQVKAWAEALAGVEEEADE